MRLTNPLGSFVARDTAPARVDARVKILLLLACAIGLVVSLLLLMAGLILSTMQQKDKRDFEMQLIQVCRQKNAL